MAAYKDRVKSIGILSGRSTEETRIIAMCKMLASDAGMPVNKWARHFMLEVLPPRIHALNEKHNEKIA